MKPGISYCIGRIYWSTILLCILHFANFVPELPGPLEHRQNDISHNDTVKITLLVFAIYILFPVVPNSRLCCMSGLKILKRSLSADGNYWSDQDFQSSLFFFCIFFYLLHHVFFLLLPYSSFSPLLAPPLPLQHLFCFSLCGMCPYPKNRKYRECLVDENFQQRAWTVCKT